VKVRIGFGPGGGAENREDLCRLVDSMDERGFDSLWLSEVLTMAGLDPVVGLSWAGAHNPRLKLGTTMVLPGRNVVRLARSLAALDALSEGRLLVTFVPGLVHDPERQAIGVAPERRGAVLDEAVPLLRRLWAGEEVSHHGSIASFDGVSISPLPVQTPLEVWGGGMAQAALERCGRLLDGWLPSLCTPAEAAVGQKVVTAAADAAERTISPEHFGVSIGYARHRIEGPTAERLARRAKGRPLDELVPVGWPALRSLLEQFIDVGFSKFVLRPTAPPADWGEELDELAGAVLHLQT